MSASQTAVGPRRASAEATRSRLLSAGLRAFAAKGLAGTNLRDDVLAPAEVSVGSFYHQFADKTELLLSILLDAAESFRARLRAVHTGAPGRTLPEIARASYTLLFDQVDADGDAFRLQLRERDSADPRVRQFLRDERERWTSSLAEDYRRLAARADRSFDFELAAQLIAGLSFATIAQYLELEPGERPAARARLLEGLVQLTLGGVGALPPPPGPTPAPDQESPR